MDQCGQADAKVLGSMPCWGGSGGGDMFCPFDTGPVRDSLLIEKQGEIAQLCGKVLGSLPGVGAELFSGTSIPGKRL